MKRNMWNKIIAIGMAFGMLTVSMPVLAFEDEMIVEDDSYIVVEDDTEAVFAPISDDNSEDLFDESVIVDEDETEIDDESVQGIDLDHAEKGSIDDEIIDEKKVFSGEGQSYSPEDAKNETDNLIKGYLEELYLEAADEEINEKRKKRVGDRLTGINASIYQQLFEGISLVASGNRTSTVFEIKVEDLGIEKLAWTSSDLNVNEIMVEGIINPDAEAAFLEKGAFNLSQIMDALRMDCPFELYWYDTFGDLSSSAYEYAYMQNEEGEYLEFRGSIYISIPVVNDYAIDTYLIDETLGERIQTCVEQTALIIKRYSSVTDYDKLYGYLNEICNRVSYNYTAANSENTYGNPWQIIWVFDQDITTDVVCEGYAKAFQYLCDLTSFDSDVYCHIATGIMSGGTGEGHHMWNVVHMPNNKNYLVDVTNCDDGSIGAKDGLFLRGQDGGSVEDGYYFDCNGVTLTYQYDSFSLFSFGTDDLEIADVDYKVDVPDSEYIEDGIVYSIRDNKASIKGYIGEPEEVVLPEMVQGIPVISIGGNAFSDCKTLKRITLSKTIVMIEDGAYDTCSMKSLGAFKDCSSLEEVVIPHDSVLEHIGEWAFCNCENLRSIILPLSIRKLALSSFEKCINLEELALPEGLEEVSQNALSFTGIVHLHLPSTLTVFDSHYLFKLESITVDSDNQKFKSDDGVLYHKGAWNQINIGTNYDPSTGHIVGPDLSTTASGNGWGLLYYPPQKKDEEYSVCEDTEVIFTLSLQNDYLKRINTRHALFSAGDIHCFVDVDEESAFICTDSGLVLTKDGKGLVYIPEILEGEVVVPDGVLTIGVGACQEGHLKSIVLPEGLERIEKAAFYMASIETINIPSSVRYIGDDAFMDSKIKSIHIPEGVEKINRNTFLGCYDLREISLPESINYIDMQAFSGCVELKTISIPSKVKSLFYMTFGHTGLEQVVIPENIENINSWAFGDCLSLYYVTVMNADCNISMDENTFPSNTVIRGHEGSTAQQYAQTFNRVFSSIDVPCDHNWEKTPVDGYSCTKDRRELWACKACGEREYHVIPPTHVNVVIDYECSPTCTQPGLTRGSHCTFCGEIIEAQEEIPALGHTWEDGVVTTGATCIEAGVKTYTCSRCEEIKTEEIPANGHSWDEGAVTKAPTCTDTGIKTYTCSVCEETKTETIPANGHSWNEEATVDIEPTCTELGSKSIHCSVCNAVKEGSEEEIPALGHAYDSAWEWSDNMESATLVLTCSRNSTHVVRLPGDVLSEITIDATYIQEGEKTYTASVVYNGQTYEDWQPRVIPTLNPYGTTDDGFTWEVKEGVLTVTLQDDAQSTEISDYVTVDEAPWSKAAKELNVSKIVVEEGITKIGSNAFTGLDSVNEMDLPRSLTELAEDAMNVSALDTVKINYAGSKSEWDSLTRGTAFNDIEIKSTHIHTWDSGMITTPATTTAAGIKTFTCTDCGETKTEVIPVVAEQITISKKPSIKKPAAAKGKITVKWKHFKHTSKKTKPIWKKIKKVQVQCATDKGFKNIVKTATVGKSKTKATIKGLSKKTVYYVRVRYYDGTGYSKWSGVKKVKTK